MRYSNLSEMRTLNYWKMLPGVPCIFETERAARCRADAGAHSSPRGRKRAFDAWEQKNRERSEERNVKTLVRSAKIGEKGISKNGARPVRGGSAVIEGWPAILRVFPLPMAVALPTDALPPLPSTSSPISHLSKVPSSSTSSSSSSSSSSPATPSATVLMWTQGCKFSLVRNSGQEIRRASPSHRNTREAWEIWGWYDDGVYPPFPRTTVWRIVVTIPHLRPAQPHLGCLRI